MTGTLRWKEFPILKDGTKGKQVSEVLMATSNLPVKPSLTESTKVQNIDVWNYGSGICAGIFALLSALDFCSHHAIFFHFLSFCCRLISICIHSVRAVSNWSYSLGEFYWHFTVVHFSINSRCHRLLVLLCCRCN